MDRFSQPLWSERNLTPEEHTNYILEMQEENKRDLVRTYLWSFIDDELPLPDVENIMNRFPDLDLDPDNIQYYINETMKESE